MFDDVESTVIQEGKVMDHFLFREYHMDIGTSQKSYMSFGGTLNLM